MVWKKEIQPGSRKVINSKKDVVRNNYDWADYAWTRDMWKGNVHLDRAENVQNIHLANQKLEGSSTKHRKLAGAEENNLSQEETKTHHWVSCRVTDKMMLTSRKRSTQHFF